MISPSDISIIIVFLLGLELLLHIIVNPQYYLRKISNSEEREYIRERSDNYQSRSLALAGLGLALGAIILKIGNSSESTGPVIYLIGVSIGFLIVSNQSNRLTRMFQVFYKIQKLTLDYGFLTLVIAIIIFFESEAPSIGPLLLISLLIIATVRIVELGFELYIDLGMWNGNSIEKRSDFFKNIR